MTVPYRIASVVMLAVVIVLPLSFPVWAAETVLLNESFAFNCYRAAVRGDVNLGVEACSEAIEYQALGPEDLAAT